MCLYDELRDSPLHLVAKIAPWSAVSSVLAAILVDGNRLVHLVLNGWSSSTNDIAEEGGGEEVSSSLHEHHHDGLTLLGGALGFILLGGIASFLLLLVEVKLLQLTSSLTVGVLGTVKVWIIFHHINMYISLYMFGGGGCCCWVQSICF